MTTQEIYAQAIKPLRADERLDIARLILGDLTTDIQPDRPSEVRDKAHLQQMLLDSLTSGPMQVADEEFWARKAERVIQRLGPA